YLTTQQSASFVSVYLVGMGCILEDFRIIATPNSLYFSRMYLFSTKFIKKSFFYLNFEHFSALKAVLSAIFFNTANLIKTS
ncbi:hypothetical protein, partial [Acinetobacter pecorum]